MLLQQVPSRSWILQLSSYTGCFFTLGELEEHGCVCRRRQPRLPASRVLSALLWRMLCLKIVRERNKWDFINTNLERERETLKRQPRFWPELSAHQIFVTTQWREAKTKSRAGREDVSYKNLIRKVNRQFICLDKSNSQRMKTFVVPGQPEWKQEQFKGLNFLMFKQTVINELTFQNMLSFSNWQVILNPRIGRL